MSTKPPNSPNKADVLRLQCSFAVDIDSVPNGKLLYITVKDLLQTIGKTRITGSITEMLEPCCNEKPKESS